MAALHKKRFLISFQFGLLGALAGLPAAAAELTVQIGAFGDLPNPNFVEQAAVYGELLVLSGDDGITRVSIGRYASRDAARSVLQRLQIAGYNDAYIAQVRNRDTDLSGTQAAIAPAANSAAAASRNTAPKGRGLPAAPTARTPQPAARPINNSATANRPLPTTREGRPIVTPKQPKSESNSSITQAGRFRLRTHDTRSGKTSDVQLADGEDTTANQGAINRSEAVVAGLGANEIPQHLRDKLVYLDGLPHIKDGDRFIPLTEAVDDK